MPEWVVELFQNPYVLMVLLTFVPGLELRFSIPYGILVGKPWFVVAFVCIVTNILLGPIVYLFLDKMLHLALRIKLVDRMWQWMVNRVQKKIHRKVEKYGVLGLSVFIGIPLPGSGVYSGAVGGYLLGFTRREFYAATVIGVLIAGIVVTVVTLIVMMTGSTMFDFLIKMQNSH